MATRIKKLVILFLPVFLIIFFIASTDTIPVLLGLGIYLAILILLFLITLYSDVYLQTKFKFIALTLFVVSLVASFLGKSTYSFQKKINYNRAAAFIKDIEAYKVKYGKYPKGENEIEIPDSRNGLYVEKFEYYVTHIENESYIIKYFDGFWITKVYRQDERKWYTDD